MNSGIFISFKNSYYPDFFTIPSIGNLNFTTAISFVPIWDLRRKVGQKFNFEFGLGLGYIHYFKQKNINSIAGNGEIYDLYLRFGFNL